jgi:hypothetical protein
MGTTALTGERKAPSVSRHEQLFARIDEALWPAGMPTDLSRLIAQFLRVIEWADHPRFNRVTNAVGSTMTLMKAARWSWSGACLWVGDAKANHSALRMWTVRVDQGPHTLYLGICKPLSAPDYDAVRDARSVFVHTYTPYSYNGLQHNLRMNMPHSDKDPAGSLYHLTADLSSGTLRVRPMIARVAPFYRPDDPTQTEWTIAEGIDDLAECRAVVALRSGSHPSVFTPFG